MTRKLLAVLAHPDDESYGIGGTLARYVAEGVEVHVAIATDGAAGSIDEKWQGDRSRLIDARAQELKNAADVLGVHLHLLGYRDSGYINDPANKHPAAFINSDDEETVCRIVQLIRDIRPQVVITHDETGGYYHPDHIRCYEVSHGRVFRRWSGRSLPQSWIAAFPTSATILQRLLQPLGPHHDLHDAHARHGPNPGWAQQGY